MWLWLAFLTSAPENFPAPTSSERTGTWKSNPSSTMWPNGWPRTRNSGQVITTHHYVYLGFCRSFIFFLNWSRPFASMSHQKFAAQYKYVRQKIQSQVWLGRGLQFVTRNILIQNCKRKLFFSPRAFLKNSHWSQSPICSCCRSFASFYWLPAGQKPVNNRAMLLWLFD